MLSVLMATHGASVGARRSGGAVDDEAATCGWCPPSARHCAWGAGPACASTALRCLTRWCGPSIKGLHVVAQAWLNGTFLRVGLIGEGAPARGVDVLGDGSRLTSTR